MVAGFKSEWWPRSNRNPWPRCVGIRTLIDGRKTVRTLYLEADAGILRDRLVHRTGHFMPPSLLESQLQTLEEPQADEHPIVVHMEGTPEQNCMAALAALKISRG